MLLTLVLLASIPTAAVAAEHGTLIVNTATFSSLQQPPVASSATFVYVVRTDATLEFFRYAPGLDAAKSISLTVPVTAYQVDAADPDSFVDLPAPYLLGATEPLDLSRPLPLSPATVFHRGEPIFLLLTDLDQNLDPQVAETVLVVLTSSGTGDREVLRLTETGPSTGVFAGYIQSVVDAEAPFDGKVTVQESGEVRAQYTDPRHPADTATGTTLFDPAGRIFDSRTGMPVNGVRVTIIDVATGLPATVYGEDRSSYPSTVVSGGTATGGNGNLYDFPPGGYRFPLLEAGKDYRLALEVPNGWTAPSTVPTHQLQTLPGAPWAIVTGSRGEPFTLPPVEVLWIDIPIDPLAGSLWLAKQAGKSVVGIGDFLPFRLTLNNPDENGGVRDAIVTDYLPRGFRYQRGSARLDGTRAADPTISANGRTLTFAVGDLDPQANRTIAYVVEVTAGAKTGLAVNTASANASLGVTSNTAEATVTVRDDFFRSTTFLMGQIFTGACGEAVSEEGAEKGVEKKESLAGIRIYLEDGTFVLTDEQGRFHFTGVRPGTHVVQLDRDTLPERYEVLPCEENSRFAGRSFSQFVDLQGGSMWRVDFHLGLKPPARGEAAMAMSSALDGNEILYTFLLRGEEVPLRRLRLHVSLPTDIVFQPGSALLDGAPLADPLSTEGGLIFALGEADGTWEKQLTLRATIGSVDESTEMRSRSRLLFDTSKEVDQSTSWSETVVFLAVEKERLAFPKIVLNPRFDFATADLAEEDRAQLDPLAEDLQHFDIQHIFSVGHTDNIRIAPAARNRYADNFALSEARAESVARYLSERLQLTPAQTTVVGLGEAVPVADNATAEGRAMNRRVELRILAEKILRHKRLELIEGQGETQTVATTGLRPGEAPMAAKVEKKTETATVVDGILSPADGSRLPQRIAAVRVSLDSRLKPKLLLDGIEIPADRIGFKMEDKETRKTLYSYIGVDFGDKGKRVLHLQGLDPFGNTRVDQRAEVVRTGEIAVIRQIETDGGNIADGKTPIKVRLLLLDSNGEPINASTTMEIRDGNLRPLRIGSETAQLEASGEGATVQIDADGWARFEPTQGSGLYHATLGYTDREIRVDTYVRPELRDWILIGLAEGTVGYNTVSGRMESIDAGVEENFFEDGRLAFFAKGQVQGKWLLTMAYDSDKPDLREKKLFQTIDPGAYYTLYGDATVQGYDAPSAHKLFLKIERDQFYALFGDFNTGLSVTELSAYNRSLTGVKTELRSRHFEVNAFASDTSQAFVKDEIPGDGTSGLYRISRRDIVVNSEKIVIETRDRFHSQVVLSSTPLSRFIDYQIDYDDGTLFFKAPIASRDESFNPIFIVIDYEADDTRDRSYTYGGRVAARTVNGGLIVGASGVREGQTGGEGNLYGVDATWKITEATAVRAEAATSDTTVEGLDYNGSAWLAEIVHNSGRMTCKAYYRQLGEGFGLGQQSASEQGTRKYGLESNWRLGEAWGVTGLAYRHFSLDSGNRQDVVETAIKLAETKYSLTFGLRRATDHLHGGDNNDSNQVTLGGSLKPYGGRLTLHAGHDQSLGGSGGSANFPTRTSLGADYQLTRAAAVFAAQEFTWGENEDTRGTRAGLKTTPWKGAAANSSVEQRVNENGSRVFANLGLKQTLQINERLSLDGGLDRSETLRHPGNTPVNENAPPASGGGDNFTAFSVGARYKEVQWSWDNRLEYRTADSEDKWGLFSGIIGEPQPGLALSARAQLFLTEAASGAEKTSGDLSFGLAHRPHFSRWIILDRLDYIYDRNTGGDINLTTWRVINNLNINYKPNRRSQLSLQYGAKYVQENIDGDDYRGFTDLIGVEGRYDLTKTLDIGLRGSVLHSWNSGALDYLVGPSVGYNVVKNAWVSVGYNMLGFHDPDFSRADFTAQGPYLKMRVKFDQDSVREALQWL